MFARTPNLLLRPAWSEDAPVLAAMVASELSFGDLIALPRPSDYLDADPALPKLLVFLRTDGAPKLIGTAGLKPGAAGETELDLWIAAAHRGRGFGGEAARALVSIAGDALRLKRLTVRHRQDDPAAVRLLSRLGFRPCPGSAGGSGQSERREPSRLVVCEPAMLARAA